ncbi:hypothetical protein [Streptomyces sp. NPDC089799]|uniref:hypothetical protein n=1 Tax=Streptomyces sp. NPDC089799 TaxID=3155066 RepID=UPI003449FCFB
MTSTLGHRVHLMITGVLVTCGALGGALFGLLLGGWLTAVLAAVAAALGAGLGARLARRHVTGPFGNGPFGNGPFGNGPLDDSPLGTGGPAVGRFPHEGPTTGSGIGTGAGAASSRADGYAEGIADAVVMSIATYQAAVFPLTPDGVSDEERAARRTIAYRISAYDGLPRPVRISAAEALEAIDHGADSTRAEAAMKALALTVYEHRGTH